MGYADGLRHLCELRGIPQADLAERLGMSRSSLSRILRGVQELKLSQAYQLAKLLGVSLDALVEGATADGDGRRVEALDEEERTILRIVRRLGPEVALGRLLGLDRLDEVEPGEVSRKG